MTRILIFIPGKLWNTNPMLQRYESEHPLMNYLNHKFGYRAWIFYHEEGPNA